MKLSIIIPYYNTPAYTDELLECLDRQMTDDVEVILVDDGSDERYRPKYEWLTVYRTRNRGQSKARNFGLNRALGEYIQFIDSDDLVAPDFISRLFEKMDGADLIEFSWRSLNTNGALFNYQIHEGMRLTNPSVCTRTFKRSYIGKVRFSEIKDATEDEDFSRRLGYLYKDIRVNIIPEYMYYYRTDVVGSNVKRYKNGLCKTKRVVYYFDHVTADRTDILEAIKEDDKVNEVFLLTNQNDMPELRRWCQILRPMNIWTHYLKGEPFMGCSIVQIPEQSEIILFSRRLHFIGGIETFIYQFGQMMKDHEVSLLIQELPKEQEEKLSKVVRVIKYREDKTYRCKTLIMERITEGDNIPPNIFYNKAVQHVHACRTSPAWHIPQGLDDIVTVSKVSKESFGREGDKAIVIHNPITIPKERALTLISATRVPAPDKGGNEERMIRLAEMMNEAQIPFIWLNFSENQLIGAPKNLYNVGMRDDIMPYIKNADYLVQLSKSEAWSYSVLEALVLNKPVIVTEFPSAYEMGIEDGVNGYILPFDMNFDVHRLLKIPKFKYQYDNEKIKEQWEDILKGGKYDR